MQVRIESSVALLAPSLGLSNLGARRRVRGRGAVPRVKAASEAVPRAKKMRKKRKLDESEEGARAESASCAEAVVRDLDACEIHVVTFSAPEWHFDAAEAVSYTHLTLPTIYSV